MSDQPTQDGSSRRDLDLIAGIRREVEQLSPGSRQGVVAPGARLGNYYVLSRIGRGGFAEVWQARDERLGREVALKLLLHAPGAERGEALAEYLTEARALSTAEHDHVVRVWNAGVLAAPKLPFIDMELCAGSVVDKAPMPPREAARIVASAARGVAAAHARGIVHRDIKPSNILLDARGRAKLGDFGLARPGLVPLAEHADAERTQTVALPGGAIEIVGTPAYMSPEQAQGEEATPLSDIYGLGSTLHFLLSGAPPYGFDGSTAPPNIAELLRRVADPEQRPGPLPPGTPRPLALICEKAMAKSASQRYQTAEKLADDLECWLALRPASVERAGWRRRLALACRRNPVLASVGTGALVAVVGGAIVSMYWAIRATRAERAARALQREAERERGVATNERDTKYAVVAAMIEIFGAVNPESVGREVGESVRLTSSAPRQSGAPPSFDEDSEMSLVGPNPEGAGRQARVVDALARASETARERFAKQPLVLADVRQTLGVTFHALGMYADAERELRSAWELRRKALGDEARETLQAASSLAQTLAVMHKPHEAETILTDTLAAQTRLWGAEDPDSLTTKNALAAFLAASGRLREAEPLARAVVEGRAHVLGDDALTANSLGNLGQVLMAAGRIAEAEPFLERAASIHQRVSPVHPDALTAANNLAMLYLEQERFGAAERLLRDTVEARRVALGEDHRETLLALANLGSVYLSARRDAKAEVAFREALQPMRRLWGEEHPEVLTVRNNLAVIWKRQERFDDAEAEFRAILAARERAQGRDHVDTLVAKVRLAQLLYDRGQVGDAEALCREALAGLRSTAGNEHPETLVAINALASMLWSRDELDEAERLYSEALDVRVRQFGPTHSDSLQLMNNLATVAIKEKRYAEAAAVLREVVAATRQAFGEDAAQAVEPMNNLAYALEEQGKRDEAEDWYRRSIEITRRAQGDDAAATGAAMGNLAALLQARGARSEAEPLFRETFEGCRRAFGPAHEYTILAEYSYATCLHDQQRNEDALALLREALTLAEANLRADHTYTPVIRSRYGRTLVDLERYEEAEPQLLDAMVRLDAALGRTDQKSMLTLRALLHVYEALSRPEDAARIREELATRESEAARPQRADPDP